MVSQALENRDSRVLRILYVYSQRSRSGSIAANVRPDEFGEKLQYFTVVCVAARLALAVDLLTVNNDIKNTLAAGNEPEVRDDVLVVRK